MRILDEHRAGLGAIDLRAYASGHRAEATALGLRMAIEDGRAARVLEWAEHSRASHLLLRPVRPPDDPELAAALTELRAIVAEAYRRRGTDRGTARLVRRQIMLERHIRDHHRQQRSEEPFQAMEPVPPSRLAAALGESALVEFIQLDDRLIAVTVVAGRIRLWRLPPLAHIRDHIERVPFALHRLSRRNVNRASQEAAVTMLRHAAKHIDEALFGPLAGEIGDRPLVLIPTGTAAVSSVVDPAVLHRPPRHRVAVRGPVVHRPPPP